MTGLRAKKEKSIIECSKLNRDSNKIPNKWRKNGKILKRDIRKRLACNRERLLKLTKGFKYLKQHMEQAKVQLIILQTKNIKI